MASKKPLVIQLTKATDSFPKGTELGAETEAAARKVYGDDFKIVRYQDNTAYEPPAPPAPASSESASA